MTFLGSAGLLNFLTSLSLGIFVLLNRPKELLNRVYFGLNLSVAVYSWGYFMWQMSTTADSAFYWFRWLMVGNMFIHIAYFPFVFTVLGTVRKHRVAIGLVVAANAFFIWMNQVGLLYTSLEKIELGYWPVITWWFHGYLVFWHVGLLYAFAWLLRGLSTTAGPKRQQIKLITGACALGFFGGATNWLMFYRIDVPPYPVLLISAYVGLIAYAVIRHRLLDFNLVMRWGAAYAIFVVALGAATVPLLLGGEVLFRRASIPQGYFSILLACSMVFVIGPARRLVTRFVDQIIFRSPDFQVILSGIEDSINSRAGVAVVRKRVSEQLERIWGVDHVGFAVWNYHDAQFTLLPEASFTNKGISRLGIQLNKTDFLVRTLESERRLFLYGVVTENDLTALGTQSLSGERITFWKIRRSMRWIGAAACVPMMMGVELVGFLILGPKRNKATYSQEDKKFLAHLAGLMSQIFDETAAEKLTQAANG